MILGTSGCAHELRGDAAVPKVWTTASERARRRRNQRCTATNLLASPTPTPTPTKKTAKKLTKTPTRNRLRQSFPQIVFTSSPSSPLRPKSIECSARSEIASPPVTPTRNKAQLSPPVTRSQTAMKRTPRRASPKIFKKIAKPDVSARG